MCYRLLFWTIYLLSFNAYYAYTPEIWLNYFKANPKPTLMTITKHRLGMNYIRGFPSGILGTRLFPLLPERVEEDTSGIRFWKDYLTRNPMPGTSITDEFQKFYSYAYEYFCKDWQCCKSGVTHPSCTQKPKQTMELISLLIDPKQSLQILFLYHWCIHAWEEINRSQGNENLKEQAISHCPNPCHGNPCRSVKAAVNETQCDVVGAFENDYKCHCDRLYEWDPHKLVCTPRNPCSDEAFPPCVPNNTVACLARNTEEVLCVCRDEFMGVDCSLPRDACVERVNKSAPNGNTNCQVQLGNICKPIIGTDHYVCSCAYGYNPILTMAENNCFGRFDPCKTEYVENTENYEETGLQNYPVENETLPDSSNKPVRFRSLTCLNGGQCVTSSDMTRASCVCPRAADGTALFTGLNCEIAIGIWSGWSLLSPCLPSDCGQSRYRWRRRQCLNNTRAYTLVNLHKLSSKDYSIIQPKFTPHTRCPGTSEEVLSCDLLDPCAVLRLPGKLRDEIFDYSSLLYFGYVTLAEVVFSVLVWYVFANPVLAWLQKRRTKKKPAELIE